MDLNKVMIIGRLTRDPELRSTPNGANVCQMSLATNYVYTDQQNGQKVEQVEYHNIVLWRGLADIASKYLAKGRRVYIEGRLRTQSWDAQDGTKKSRTEIVAENMIMLDGGQGGAAGAGNGAAPAATSSNYGNNRPQQNQNNQPSYEEELPTIQAGEDISVEDIPF